MDIHIFVKLQTFAWICKFVKNIPKLSRLGFEKLSYDKGSLAYVRLFVEKDSGADKGSSQGRFCVFPSGLLPNIEQCFTMNEVIIKKIWQGML